MLRQAQQLCFGRLSNRDSAGLSNRAWQELALPFAGLGQDRHRFRP